MKKVSYCSLTDLKNLRKLGNEKEGTFKARKKIGKILIENGYCFTQNPTYSDLYVFPNPKLKKLNKKPFKIQIDTKGQQMDKNQCKQLKYSNYQANSNNKGLDSIRRLGLGRSHKMFDEVPKMSKEDAKYYDDQCKKTEKKIKKKR